MKYHPYFVVDCQCNLNVDYKQFLTDVTYRFNRYVFKMPRDNKFLIEKKKINKKEHSLNRPAA